MDKTAAEIKLLELADLYPGSLQYFNRYQVTKRVRYKDGEQYFYKDDDFIEHWDEQKKRQVIESLKGCIISGGIVAGAFMDGKLIGFANVENKFFGKSAEYLELPYIHVSCEYRGLGIGKKLFRLCCKKARVLGAKKLYISSHPAEETQSFYDSLGCVPAVEINKEIFDKEPLDIQLEFLLQGR